MRLVIAGTGPIHYLILIGHIDLLPHLFERVVLPSIVLTELSHPLAQASVQRWIAAVPAWLEIAESPAVTLSPVFTRAKPRLSLWPLRFMRTCC